MFVDVLAHVQCQLDVSAIVGGVRECRLPSQVVIKVEVLQPARGSVELRSGLGTVQGQMQEILIVPQCDDGVDDAITDHERMNAGLVLTDRSFAALAIVKLDALLMEQSFVNRSEEHTSELQSLMRISYAVFCL